MEIYRNPNKNKRRNNVGHSIRQARRILVASIIVLIVGFAIIAPMAFMGAPNDALIRIPKNATQQEVSDSLKKYLGDKYAQKTMYLLKMRHVDFSRRYGSYEIPKGMSAFSAMRRLGSGGQQPVDIIVNGYRSMSVLADKISQKMNFTSQEFIEAASDSATLAQYGLKPQQAMALFLDDTYEVYWTATPEEVVKKIGQNYKLFWSNSRKHKASLLGVTPAEVVIISSITDEETLDNNEKGRISRLYLNRLGAGMKLQADPTVRYALHDFTIRRVTGIHLQVESPYNTYKYAGLPPGPIRTTGRTTIDALLNSTPTSDMYMCAKEDFSGSHNFSATYEEHQANAERYQKALDARGIN